MKTSIRIVLFFVLSVSLTQAGEIYGVIKEGERPVSQGVKVEILIGEKHYSTETDDYGSYSIYVAEKGECTLMVHYKDQSPSITAYSYEDSVRYNLVLEKRNGEYHLRRD